DTAPTNEFQVDGSLIVNDYLYLATPFPAVSENFSSILGVLRYANNNSKVEPRDANDLLSGDAVLAGFNPTEVFLEAGQTTNALLSLSLTRPAGQQEVVGLSCAPANVLTCPATVTFSVGQQTVPVELTGVNQALNPATITATLGTSNALAAVRVYDDTTPRQVVGLMPDPLNIAPSTVAPMTVLLDLPAASTGTPVGLSASNGFVTVPPGVLVPAGQMDGDFNVTAGANQGASVITAARPGSQAQADVIVDAVPVGSGLLFSEYLEGSSGNNKYLEIKNIDANPIDLTGCAVHLYANGAVAPSATISLGSSTLASGDVFLVCHSSATFTTGAPCDVSNGSLTFNGDDAVDLACGATTYDVIGQIGVQQVWGTGAVSTQNAVIRRLCTVTAGDSDGTDVFDPAIEWVGGTTDDASDLGLPTCP
ncbi:MAG: lamin tail domain-containing protein, partial [Myxococcales bacterium]|nr:lamin tail domain-containing protein [Myxococcales bacterium]